jgi:hypothetical protein
VKIGDLVKRKFVTFAQARRVKSMNENIDIDEVGIVVEVAENACKVLFVEKNQIRSFLQSSLEIIKE